MLRTLALWLLASGCGGPAHPGPHFEVTSAPPQLGTVFFHLAATRMIGRVELPWGLATDGKPLRLAVLWSATFDGLRAPPRTLTTLDARTGALAFDVEVATPPEEFIGVVPDVPCGRFATSFGQVVAFIDLNENGELDRFDADPIDRVVGSSIFPWPLLGFDAGGDSVIAYSEFCKPGAFSASGAPTGGVAGEVKFPLFDDARMNLVVCNASAVFTAEVACGIQTVQTPVIRLLATSTDTDAVLSISGADGLEVFVDDESQGVIAGGGQITRSSLWLTDEHHVRVEGAGLRPWEGAVRWPQPLVMIQRPSVLVEGETYPFVWSTQPGVTMTTILFDLGHGRGSLQSAGGSVSYTQFAPALGDSIHFEVTAEFTGFPGGAGTQFDIPVRRK